MEPQAQTWSRTHFSKLKTKHLVTTLASHQTHAATCTPVLSLALNSRQVALILVSGSLTVLTSLQCLSVPVSLFSVSRPIFNCRPSRPGPVSARSSPPGRQLRGGGLPRFVTRYYRHRPSCPLLAVCCRAPLAGNIQIIFSTDSSFSLAPHHGTASPNGYQPDT